MSTEEAKRWVKAHELEIVNDVFTHGAVPPVEVETLLSEAVDAAVVASLTDGVHFEQEFWKRFNQHNSNVMENQYV